MQRTALLAAAALCIASAWAAPAAASTAEPPAPAIGLLTAALSPSITLPAFGPLPLSASVHVSGWTPMRSDPVITGAISPLDDVDEPSVVHIDQICTALAEAARQHELPLLLFARLIWFESRFDRWAVSRAGARGVAQIMPGVAAEIGLSDPFDPIQALPASARLLRELHGRFGNWGLAAAAYNAGTRRVREWMNQSDKSSGLPLETRRYVTAITGLAPEDWTDLTPKLLELKLPKRVPCHNLPEAEVHAFAHSIPMPPERPGPRMRETPPPTVLASAASTAADAWPLRSAPVRSAAPRNTARNAAQTPIQIAAAVPFLPGGDLRPVRLDAVSAAAAVRPVPAATGETPLVETARLPELRLVSRMLPASPVLADTPRAWEVAALAATPASAAGEAATVAARPGLPAMAVPAEVVAMMTPTILAEARPSLVEARSFLAGAGPSAPALPDPPTLAATESAPRVTLAAIGDHHLAAQPAVAASKPAVTVPEAARAATVTRESRPTTTVVARAPTTLPPEPQRERQPPHREVPVKELQWAVQIAAHWSRDQAFAGYERMRRQHPTILAQFVPMAVTGRPLAGRGAVRTEVQVPMETREAAEEMCQRLRAAGGACMVLRNN